MSDKPVKTAIVAEGGGQRGIYTAGALDAFLKVGFNPFNHGIGVSAGAQNLFTYFLQKPGYARRAIAELTSAPDFFVPYRWTGSRSIIDLDGYFERSQNDPEYRLPFQKITAVQEHRRLHFVATDRTTLEPVYLEPDHETVVPWLKASSAVPYLYREGVQFGDRVLVDGGVADPIPVQYAYELGAKRVLVIRTSSQTEPDSVWRSRLVRSRHLRALPLTFIRMLESYQEASEAAQAFIESPPHDLELIELAPEQALQSQVFGSRSDRLHADYSAGLADGERVADELIDWQNQYTPGHETVLPTIVAGADSVEASAL